jgi:hypothetical protein
MADWVSCRGPVPGGDTPARLHRRPRRPRRIVTHIGNVHLVIARPDRPKYAPKTDAAASFSSDETAIIVAASPGVAIYRRDHPA